jgi:hypothetical protein
MIEQPRLELGTRNPVLVEPIALLFSIPSRHSYNPQGSLFIVAIVGFFGLRANICPPGRRTVSRNEQAIARATLIEPSLRSRSQRSEKRVRSI